MTLQNRVQSYAIVPYRVISRTNTCKPPVPRPVHGTRSAAAGRGDAGGDGARAARRHGRPVAGSGRDVHAAATGQKAVSLLCKALGVDLKDGGWGEVTAAYVFSCTNIIRATFQLISMLEALFSLY